MNLKISVQYKHILVAGLLSGLILTACSHEQQRGNAEIEGKAIATLPIDGSSTVFPISEAMAEEFMKVHPEVRVTVGVSGSGGGFKKFCAGEIDITNASRPINDVEEELCEKNAIEYIEIPIAFDGISVVVNPENHFVSCLTRNELKTMWEAAAQGKINNWNQISPEFPDLPLRLYGPGTDSGTYDYFTAAIIGNEGESRGDFSASEDDNVIVQGVAGDPEGLGFFGYAYYKENKNKLKIVEINGGKGCVAPTPETIADSTYQPLSRPEFFYVNKAVASHPDVKAFVEFKLAPENQYIISEVGYVPLPKKIIEKVKIRYDKGKKGSIFKGGSTVGIQLGDLLEIEE